ncbi:MAG: ABC transporter permease, partial [Cyclobacteriaceae bacterium]|nr:ABC transporter permease [Cyclobacteriaceae bacterium]
MIKNYLLVALRSLRRNKLHATINIAGLAIGMTCCILIALYVQFELGYDRQNKNADNIYRLTVDLEANNWAISAFPLGALLKDNFPEVQAYTRFKPTEAFLQNAASPTLIKNKEKVFYADSSVFDVMDIELIKGDPRQALANINSIVLTEEKARTYFGDQDPMGKTLTMLSDKKEYVVTGIFKPLPSNSHVHMNIMVSSDNFEPMRPNSPEGWNYLTNHYTYVVLPSGTDYLSLEKKISAFLDKFTERKPEDPANVIHLQPLTSIHLYSNLGLEVEANGNVSTVYTLAAIAFFILIIACINFMNLATAQSMRRAKEVGIRKVVGSRRTQLVFQFLSESVVISIFALVLAVGLLALAVPQFNEMSGKVIDINPLENGWVLLFFGGITLFVGILAGVYPAFFLSRFSPVLVLKGKFVGNRSGQLLRKALVVFQFAIAFIIMVGTYIVYFQLDFMLKKDMGFDREQVMVITMPRDSIGDRSIKNELARLSGVASVTRFNEIPGRMVRTSGFWYEGIEDLKAENLYNFSGDADLLHTLGMKMKAGTYFADDNFKKVPEFVINETAVKHFGWKLDEAVGKLMDFGGRSATPGRV